MSVAATMWAWDQDVPGSQKLVLLAYGDQSRDDGAVQLVQADLRLRTGLSERAVRDNLSRLESSGHLRRYPRYEGGQRVADITKLAVDSEVELPADFAGEKVPRGFAGSATPRGSIPADSAPPVDSSRTLLPTGNKGAGGRRRDRQQMPVVRAEVPDDLLGDADALLRRRMKVGTTLVTGEEMAVAVAALAEFNRQAEYDYGLATHLTKIVGRVRERPSLDAATHVRLVQSAWRLRWWERNGSRGGRASPSVVYGNGDVFERVIQDATDEKKGKPVGGDQSPAKKRFVREGPPRES